MNPSMNQLTNTPKLEDAMPDQNQVNQVVESKQVSTNTQKSKPWYKKRKWIISGVLLFTFVAVLTGLIAPAVIIGKKIQVHVATAQIQGTTAYEALKNQDLLLTNQEIEKLSQTIFQISSDYSRLRYFRYTPLAWHYEDGLSVIKASGAGVQAGKILVHAIEPYADVLGFTADESEHMEGTAEDRIVMVIETLDQIMPSLDRSLKAIDYIDQQLNSINPKRYPYIKMEGQQNLFATLAYCTDTTYTPETHTVEELVNLSKTCIHQISLGLNDFRPVLEALPAVAGADEPKTYLVLFQNDGELRPTGGFMTAYAILNVESGKVTPERSDDIYELDAKFRSNPPLPEPIKKYLPSVLVWNLRDMNLSPDFRESMDLFTKHYTTVPGEPEIDGIIAVDTQVLTRLLEVLGPVEVPGYGTFSHEIDPRCDCPQVVYALEDMITRPTPYHRSDRKGVLGPLMQMILSKAYEAPKNVWPELFQSIIAMTREKHILFYFMDESLQDAAESINVAGRIIPPESTDYLHINDTNFGGAKSNMFVTQEVDQTISIEDNLVRHELDIVYKNPRPADNCNLEAGELCLNGVLPNWTRIYLPLGSELVEARGFREDSVEVSEDLGLTVIEGFFSLNPQSQARVTLSYTTPYSPNSGVYRQLIQKQPGTRAPQWSVTLLDIREEFDLTTDKEIIIPLD